MYEHHKISIDNLIEYFKPDPEVIAVVLGGSVAKGLERPDSDIDAAVVVTEEKYQKLSDENRLAECIFGHCPYDGGYFDIKYYTKAYLSIAAEKASEPSRNAFIKSKVLYTSDDEVSEIIARIPVFQKQQKEDKMLSFYSALRLSSGFFWNESYNNPYLRLRAVSDIALFGLRMVLQQYEILFPCQKSMFKAIANIPADASALVEKCEAFMKNPDDSTKDAFIKEVMDLSQYQPPKDYSEVLTRYIDDNEIWWYKNRPVISEW